MWPFKASPEQSFRKGLGAMESGKYEIACIHFNRVLNSESMLKNDAYYNLGICFLKMEKYGLAAENIMAFCNRLPEEATPQLYELIEVLIKADKLPFIEGKRLFQNYTNKITERQSSLMVKGSQIQIDEFMEKVDDIVHSEPFQMESPFDEILKSFSANIPMQVYGINALKNINPSEAFGMCDAFIRWGVSVSFAVLEYAGKEYVDIKLPPYDKKPSGKELSKRCPLDWLFIEAILRLIIDYNAKNFISVKPWVTDSIDAIKEDIIKEFIYIGFSIGLESAGY